MYGVLKLALLKVKYVFIVKWALDNFNFSLITDHQRYAFQEGIGDLLILLEEHGILNKHDLRISGII